MKLRAAVLTISDSVSQGTRTDRSGPAVRGRLEAAGWEADAAMCLPDEREQISSALAALAGSGDYSAIFTTGGTGVGPRDVTPEATRAVIEREIPGLAEVMRAEGRKRVVTAVLSRAVAGTLGRTLIVNLPGSPKGAVESLDAILNVVAHVVELLEGRTEHDLGSQRAAPAPRLEEES